jgi:hypothetical protein
VCEGFALLPTMVTGSARADHGGERDEAQVVAVRDAPCRPCGRLAVGAPLDARLGVPPSGHFAIASLACTTRSVLHARPCRYAEAARACCGLRAGLTGR